MGIYLYGITAKKRKMTTGEEVNFLKYLSKPSWGYGREEPYRKEYSIDTTLAAYEFGQAEPVFKFHSGSNLWYDSDENRRELYGYMLRDGKNRYRIRKGELPPFYGQSYELVESKGSDDGGHYSMSNSNYMKTFGKYENGQYWFELRKGNSSDGEIVHSTYFWPISTDGYDEVVRTVAEHLVLLYEAEERLCLKEAG